MVSQTLVLLEASWGMRASTGVVSGDFIAVSGGIVDFSVIWWSLLSPSESNSDLFSMYFRIFFFFFFQFCRE